MSYRYIIAFSLLLSVFLILDVYVWKALRQTIKKKHFRILKWLIPFSTFLFFLGFGLNIYRGYSGIVNASLFINLMFGTSLGFFIAKGVLVCFFLVEDGFRIFKFLIQRTKKKIHPNTTSSKVTFSNRRTAVRNIGLTIASIPFASTLYGITIGKYQFHVKRKTLYFNRLPTAFEGLKVVQFSDFHAGSFDDHKAVERGLELINEEQPDLVLFTGDLVNNRAPEVLPYLDSLKKIQAPLGKFAILGNHDYGDYVKFDSEQERTANLKALGQHFENTGFQLLKNENSQLKRGKDSIYIAGVENWGRGPFPQYGDIEEATKGISSKAFTILMSHDPDHWEYVVREHPFFIDFTLSGHTHGGQFGVNIPNWKWSPVKYRYKRWLGYYQVNQKQLFVSKGFGFLGFPGRVGMTPEIVSFRLKRRPDKPL